MKKLAAFIGLSLLAATAEANPGHGAHGFISGMMHPLGGWDHWLAMLCIGLWSAQQDHGKAWTIPLGFAAVLLLALAVGAAAVVSIPFEAGIAASILVVGLLLAGAVRLPLAAGYGIVALCAVFHGIAHGAEMPAGVTVWSFGIGMVGTTLAVQFAGFAAVKALRHELKRAIVCRAAGWFAGAVGVLALAF